MPYRSWTSSVAAGDTYEPLSGWQHEYMPVRAMVKILHNATAVGMVVTITSGSETLVEEGPVGAGGTAGVLPPENTVEPIMDEVMPGDRLKVRYRNTTGGAVTVNGSLRF